MKLEIKTNEDEKKVEDIKIKIKENDGYCPCLLERTKDTKCPCKEFREINEPGYCTCGLYKKVEV